MESMATSEINETGDNSKKNPTSTGIKFSWKDFLSETFGSHPSPQYEERLSVGTKLTTPQLNSSMASMPKPWLFIRVLSATLLGYLLLLLLLNHYEKDAIRLLPALIFYGCFAIPCAVLTLFFEMNSPQNVSVFFLTRLLIIGGALSFLFTFILFDYLPLEKIYGASSAGLIEETAKFVVIVIFSRSLVQGRHPWILNGLLYGATVGVGYAAFESAGYALDYGLSENSFESLNDLILIRGVLAPFNHIPWTAISGAALWIAYREHKNLLKAILSIRFISLYSLPMALHFAWNFSVTKFFQLPPYVEHIKWVFLGLIVWIVIARLLVAGMIEISEELWTNAQN